MDIVWILCFILTVIQTVYCSFCPLVNDRMNITRTIDPSTTFIIWNKNGIPITTAEYLSSSGQCFAPSSTAGYTIYCASGGVYTLEIHDPVNGDLYETAPVTLSPRTYVQDPVNIDVTLTPSLSEDQILHKSEILSFSCSVGCTTPTPYIQWMYQVGETQQVIRNVTTSTSCSSGTYSNRSITDNLEVSYSLISLNDVTFKVVCQVQYSDCDINIDGNSSASTDYFITFKGQDVKCIVETVVIVGIVVMVIGDLIVIIGIFVFYYCSKRKERGSGTGKICGIVLMVIGMILNIIGIILFFSFNESIGTFGECLVEIVVIILIIIWILLLIICIVVLCLFNKKTEGGMMICFGGTSCLAGFCYWKRRRDTPDQPDPPPVPDPPLDINYKTRGADNIVVTWRAGGGNGGGPQTFIVQQSQDNKSWTNSTTKPTPITEYRIENLQPDTAYYIRVIAHNTHGDSDPEKGVVLLVRTKKRGSPEPPKPQGVPDPPLDINYKTRGADNIVVTWRPSGNGGDQQQFIVQQSKDNKHWTDSTTKPIPLNEYSIEKLQPDTAYYIRVVARNKHGDSQPEQGIVLLIRTKKQDSSSTAVVKRRREDPENGVELTDRVRTPLNS